MPDTLLDAIDRGLLQQLDEDEFERCATFAIGQMYPTLVPIEGGNDLGQDGVALSADLEPIVLCSTVGSDVIGNLRKNLDRYLSKGGRARLAFVATNQKLSATRIRNLEEAASKRGFRLLQVFPHGWFHRYLYADAGWRVRLLGLAGDPPALTLTPLSRRPQMEIPLVGRGEIHDRLASLNGDLVLYGEPGSGKTSLLANLVEEGWGRFAVDDDRGRLADGLREFRPTRVIVDDAHLRPELLETLVHLRTELSIPFSLVATCWPDWSPSPGSVLSSPQEETLSPLTRDEMLEVVKSLGLVNVEFQRSVIDQSMGRPGLATTLVGAALSGRARDVWMGDTILADVAGVIGGRLGSPEDLTALGVLSLGHESGLTAAEFGEALGRDVLWVNGLLRRVASGGIIDSRRRYDGTGAFRVQPAALRFALVYETFGSPRAVLDVATILARLPQPSVSGLPLVYCLHRGAKNVEAVLRTFVKDGLLNSSTLASYASIGSHEASIALGSARAEDIPEIAVAAIEAAPDIAVSALLDSAVGDDRPRHSYPGHPMRQLGDYLHESRNPLERRQAVGEAVRRWVAKGGSADTAMEAFCLVLHPGVGGSEVSPGSSMSFTIWRGAFLWEGLKQLVTYWDDVVQLASRPEVNVSRIALEPLGNWLWPGRVLMGGGSAPDSWYRQVRRVGRHVIQRMGAALLERPGQLQALRRTARRARVSIAVRPHDDFSSCYPERESLDGDFSPEKQAALDRSWDRGAKHLSDIWLAWPARRVARRLASIEKEAASAELSYPRLSTVVARYYAAESRRPLSALREFANAGVPADLQQPLVERVFDSSGGSPSVMKELLGNPASSQAAAWVCLCRPVGSAILDLAIEVASTWAWWGNEQAVWSLRSFTPAAQLRLLECPYENVKRGTVLGLATLYPDGIPPVVDAKWRELVPRTPASSRLERTLTKEPELLAAWTDDWARRAEDPNEAFESFPDRLLPCLAELPIETRRMLLASIGPRKSVLTDEVVARLVADDLDTIKVLFQQDRKRFQRAALSGEPDAIWLQRASIAHDAGWSVQAIVDAQIRGVGVTTMVGPQSEYWEAKAAAFRVRLDKAADGLEHELWQTGVEICEAERDAALAQEHHEAVYGLDR